MVDVTAMNEIVLPTELLKQAVAAESFMSPAERLSKGDTAAALASADPVLEGQLRVGGQEHFYLETMACVALPKGEDGEMEMFVTTQAPAFVQVEAFRTVVQ